MPNRIIKESIRTSKTLNSLTDFKFRVWVNLITYVDDYGRGSADPELLKAFVFPRRKGVTESNIMMALTALACSGLVRLYKVDGEPYFCFPTWGDHQRIQTKQSKFPAPPQENKEKENGDFLPQSSGSFSASPSSTVSHGESPLEYNPIQSNPNTEYESESEYNTNTPATPPSRADVVSERFQAFWDAYPKKKGKADAFKAFLKLKVSQKLLSDMLEAIKKQKKSKEWTAEGGRFIPYPATWLNRGQWEDEVAVAVDDHFETSNPFLAMLHEMEMAEQEEKPIYSDFTEESS